MFAIFPLMRRWLVGLLTVVIAIELSGCNPNDFKSQAAQVTQLVDTIVGEPKTFNYALSSESPNVFSLIYEGLITENGVTAEIEPALAETWQISEDKKKIIFTLRQGLKWSDGEPLTADDVVFSFNDIYLNPDIPTSTRDGLQIGESKALPKVRKISDRQVEFTVPEPFAPLLRSAGGTPILPKHILAKTITTKDGEGKPQFLSTWGTDTEPKKVISNGPYKLDAYNTSQRVVFGRNPYYWRKDAQGNPQPYIERIIWQLVENVDTALLQFRSGGLDILEIGSRTFRLLKREEKRGSFTIYNGGPSSSTMFITFNQNKGKRNGKPLIDPIKSRWFNTVEFRQAVAYGINRQAMINNIFQGVGGPQNSPIAVQSPYYLSRAEGLKSYDYDPQKAKELLQQAGFKYNNKGELSDAQGNRVRFTLTANTGGTGFIQAQIKQDLSKIGMRVDIQNIAFNSLVDKLDNTLDWDCVYLGFTGGVEPNNAANLWLPDGSSHMFNQKPQTGQTPVEGREIASWEAEIGRLYVQGAKEVDEAKRKAIYAETQRLTQEYLPFIYLVNPIGLLAVRDRIQNIKYSAYGGPIWNIYELKAVEK